MNILMVTDEFPFPPSKNGNTENMFNLLCNLDKVDSVSVDILYIGKEFRLLQDSEKQVQKHVRNIYFTPLNNTKLIRTF